MKQMAQAVLFTFVLQTCVSAQWMINTTMRSVSASANGFCDGDSDSMSTGDVGQFSASVSVAADSIDPGGVCQFDATGNASQNSLVSNSSISGTLSAGAFAPNGGDATANSSFTVSFTVIESTPYLLDGQLTGEWFFPDIGSEPGNAGLGLTGPAGSIFSVSQASTMPEDFAQSSMLLPGEYTLSVSAPASASAPYDDKSGVVFALSVPEPTHPGDYNNSGAVEQADLDLVLLNWGTETPPIPEGWIGDPPDGLIEQNELDRVLLNWGNTSTSAGVVPEPASLMLSLGGVGIGLLRLRSRSPARIRPSQTFCGIDFMPHKTCLISEKPPIKRHPPAELRGCVTGVVK